MADLVAFLEARLNEDEAAARKAAFGSGEWDTSGPGYPEAPEVRVVDNVRSDLFETSNVFIAEHIARWDPARVLAEIAAKRRIMEEFDNARENFRNDPAPGAWESTHRADERLRTLDLVVRLLAAPYADQEDFDESWRT